MGKNNYLKNINTKKNKKNPSEKLNPDYAIGKFQSKQTYYKI